MKTVGRNDPCPCGAKKIDGSPVKFKKCHLYKPTDRFPDDVFEEFEKMRAQEAYLKSLGIYVNFVRPVLFKGKKIWALGSRVFSREQTQETFHDFIIFILAETLGQEWLKEQDVLDEKNRHFIASCFHKFQEWRLILIKEQNRKEGERWEGIPDGWSKSLICLAFDITSLRHRNQLPIELLNRLRLTQEYQGARYEIAIAAIFARLGFSIEWLSEKKDGLKHCEFIATHTFSKMHIAVEVKSRHRQGVIHTSGERNELKNYKGDVQKLLNQARQKSEYGKMPFMIFVDVNAPIKNSENWMEIQWVKDILRASHRETPVTQKNPDICTATFFTNYSFHYQSENEAGNAEHLSAIPQFTKFPLLEPSILNGLHCALSNYGTVPNLDILETK
jgi:hypothetical protein